MRIAPAITSSTEQRKLIELWARSRRSPFQRIWRAHGLKPHPTKTFQVSNGPVFVEKLKDNDTVGLYLNPPAHAVVLSVDEKARFRFSTARSRGCRSSPAASRR